MVARRLVGLDNGAESKSRMLFAVLRGSPSMSNTFSTEWSLSDVLVRLYAVVCETADTPPDVVGFLADYPQATLTQRAAVLLFDQYYHWRFGTGRRCEWYFEKFPEYRCDSLVGLELVKEEFGYRRDRGEPLTLDEFAAEFPTWADRLRSELPARSEEDRFATTAGLLQQMFHGGGLTTT